MKRDPNFSAAQVTNLERANGKITTKEGLTLDEQIGDTLIHENIVVNILRFY